MTLKEFLNLDYIDINKKSVGVLIHITPVFARFGLYNTLYRSDTNAQDDIEKYIKQLKKQNIKVVKIDGETYFPCNLYVIDDNFLDLLEIEKFIIDDNQYDMPTLVVCAEKRSK